MGETARDAAIRRAIDDVCESLIDYRTVASYMRRHPDIFPPDVTEPEDEEEFIDEVYNSIKYMCGMR